MWNFIAGFQDQQPILAKEKLNVVTADIEEPATLSGLAFPEEITETVLAKLGLTGPPKKIKTDMDGLMLLRFSDAPSDSPPGFSVNIVSWRGETTNKRSFREIVERTLLPVVKKNIEISGPHSDKVRLHSDGIFRIFLFASSPDEEGEAVSVPPKIFGTGVYNYSGLRSFSPPGKTKNSFLIVDETTGYAVAQIIGNNLYVHYNICYYGVDSEYTIFEAIIARAANWLSLSPENRLAEQKRIAEEMKKGRVLIKEASGAKGMEKLVAVAREVLLPAVKKNVALHAYSDAHRVAMIMDGDFHVFIWATVEENSQPSTHAPEKLFGLDVDCREALLPPEADDNGMIITDGKSDYAIAELFDSNLFIHHHLCCKGNPNEAEIFRRLLKVVVAELAITPAQRKKNKEQQRLERQQAEVKEDDKERQRLAESLEKTRKLYIKACAGRFPSLLEKTTETISNASEELDRLGAQLITKTKESRLLELSLAPIKLQIENSLPICAKEFDKLLAIPGVLGARIEDKTFQIYTEPILIPQAEKVYEIGQFRIDILISPECFRLRFKNLTNWGRGPGANPPEGFDGDRELNRHHPLVDQEGRAKLGKLETELPQFIGKNQYSVVVMLVLQFLLTVDPTSYAGRGLKWWPESKTESLPALVPAPKTEKTESSKARKKKVA
jgi:hypothetical protein